MFLTRHAPGAVVFSIWLILQLLLVLFTLFFFLRDRGRVLRAVRSSLPLSSAETDDVFRKVTDTVHAIVYGSLAVAVIQGTMGGLMFWWLGLPSPVLWGVIMALLAVVPNLGTFIVWAPTAVYLALSGDWGEALILAAWGGIAIAFIDNLLYPYLVGHRLRLHTLLVFIAMLGGLWLLGASGVVIGPVILVITLALVDVWRHRTSGGKSAEADVKAA
jgi:predicted PurR-regulated permease PerM